MKQLVTKETIKVLEKMRVIQENAVRNILDNSNKAKKSDRTYKTSFDKK